MFFSGKTFLTKIIPLRVQKLHMRCFLHKRTSQSASDGIDKSDTIRQMGNLAVSEEGSVTLEAAIVLPILICVFIAILLWGKIFLLQAEVESALLETARQISRQEAFLKSQDKEGVGVLSAGILFSQNRKQGDGKEGLKVSSVNLLKSEYLQETGEIYLEADYSVKVPILLLGTWKIPLKTSVRQKAWTGYVKAEDRRGDVSDYVYITEDGRSYHKDSQCYHLHVTVLPVSDAEKYYEGKTAYRPCEYCVSGERESTLYLTEDGECYHEELNCGGLTRTVSYVPASDVGGRRACGDCCGS